MVPVLDPGWASWAGVVGFGCAGRTGGLRAQVAKSAADPGGGQSLRWQRSLPGPAQVDRQRAGQPQLGVRGGGAAERAGRHRRVRQLGTGLESGCATGRLGRTRPPRALLGSYVGGSAAGRAFGHVRRRRFADTGVESDPTSTSWPRGARSPRQCCSGSGGFAVRARDQWGAGRCARIWDVTTRAEIARVGCSVTALAIGSLDPGKSRLVIVHEGAGFSLWSVTRGSEELLPSIS